MDKILVVEDDRELNEIMKSFLVKAGYEVVTAFTGTEGIQRAKETKFALILLDIMLPEVDGFEVCRDVRTHSLAPIIIVSAKNDDMDKMLALGIGADDYIEKPFSFVELQARVKSHIRRYLTFSQPKEEEHVIQAGDILIDTRAYRVRVKDTEVELTTREFELLAFLASHPSQVFHKEQLLEHVWGNSDFIDLNTITVYVGRIREKLTGAGACYIKTVWGAGYKWEIS